MDYSCPLSKSPIKDPVVLSGDGVTYERSFIQTHLISNNYSPGNKDLKLEHQYSINNYTLRSFLKNKENLIKCPLTQQEFQNPYILLDDGITYEKEAIIAWLQKNKKNPASWAHLTWRVIVPNKALMQVLKLPIKGSSLKVDLMINISDDIIQSPAIQMSLTNRDISNLDQQLRLLNRLGDFSAKDLSNLDLSNLTITGISFKLANFNCCQLSQTTFDHCDLSRTTWIHANLSSAQFCQLQVLR